jgi:hypothetical protein
MASEVRRSDERLVFYFKTQDTPTTVKRSTLRKAAKALGLDETGFLHLAAAEMVNVLRRREARPGNPDDGARLTDEQIAAIRDMEPQDIKATRSFLALLGK